MAPRAEAGVRGPCGPHAREGRAPRTAVCWGPGHRARDADGGACPAFPFCVNFLVSDAAHRRGFLPAGAERMAAAADVPAGDSPSLRAGPGRGRAQRRLPGCGCAVWHIDGPSAFLAGSASSAASTGWDTLLQAPRAGDTRPSCEGASARPAAASREVEGLASRPPLPCSPPLSAVLGVGRRVAFAAGPPLEREEMGFQPPGRLHAVRRGPSWTSHEAHGPRASNHKKPSISLVVNRSEVKMMCPAIKLS